MREEGERSKKPLPIGQRLLPNICIESEIGRMDKRAEECDEARSGRGEEECRKN